MVTESANKPSLSMAAKVKNLQNNSKFHQSVSMSFHGANFSSANFYTCTTLCHTKREKTKPKTNEKTQYLERWRLRHGIAYVAGACFIRAKGGISRTRARTKEGKLQEPLLPLARSPRALSIQGSYSFKLFKFHDFIHDLFKFSKTLGLAVSFKNFKNFPCFGVFFDLKQFNRRKLWCPPKCMPFELAVWLLLYTLHCPCLVICSN